jgi:hypothetical protein
MTPIVTENGSALRPDQALIRDALDLVKHPDYPIELRVLNVRNGGPCGFYGRTYNGFYTNLDAAVRDVSRITGRDAAGVYMSINPLNPVVLNWNANRLDRAVKAADDAQVTRLRHLFVDVDPVRPPYTNATEAERKAALDMLDQVIEYLAGEGWEPPVLAGSSGSGAMGLWRIDLPPSEVGAVEAVLAVLATRFTTDYVTIDSSVANPARIVRVPGTVNAKAPTPQPDRPWTLATAKAVTP